MALFKIFMLLLSSLSFYICLSNTTSATDPEDQLMQTSTREWIWRYAGIPSNFFLKGTACLLSIAESLVIIGSLRDTWWLPDPFLWVLGPAEASTLTTPFVFGASLVTMGSILRFRSSQTLGRYFTFQMCIRKEHKLVTSGPYTLVRHPAYGGLLLCIIGWGIVYGEPRSWLRMSGMLKATWAKVWLSCWSVLMAACIMTVFRRSAEEDRLLSRKFGREWESWARRVRYKLVPFVY